VKIRTAVAGLVAAGTLFAGGTALASGANASSPTLQTVTKTETLVSPTCYHLTQTTRTYFHWSSTAHRYVAYTAGPRVTTTNQTVCHS
jgi:hypothetical protein